MVEPPTGGWNWQPSQAAVDAFENARRNEEPQEFADQMSHDVRTESEDDNYKSDTDVEENDDKADEIIMES